MRKLKWIGLEAIQDKLGFRIYYRDGVELTWEEKQKLTLDQICELTTPQNDEEWREYYLDQQAEYELEEMRLNECED